MDPMINKFNNYLREESTCNLKQNHRLTVAHDVYVIICGNPVCAYCTNEITNDINQNCNSRSCQRLHEIEDLQKIIGFNIRHFAFSKILAYDIYGTDGIHIQRILDREQCWADCLRDLTMCSICRHVLDGPLLLNCGTPACQDCFYQMIGDAKRNNVVKCSGCDREHGLKILRNIFRIGIPYETLYKLHHYHIFRVPEEPQEGRQLSEPATCLLDDC